MKYLHLNPNPVFPAVLLLSAICVSAHGQQLPNVQTVSVMAPTNVKVDGRFTEWGGSFEAYNKNTSLSYTMANDNEKLYLVIQSVDTLTIVKIMAKGIRLTIKSVTNSTEPVKIVFPLINTKAGSYNPAVRVTGIKHIPDSIIAANSVTGIAMAALFDHQKKYTYELSLPLKYLVALINQAGTFKYTIGLDGADPASALSFSGKYTLVTD